MDRAVDGLLVPAAHGMRHSNTGTHGQADKEINDEIGDGIGGANGGQVDLSPGTYHHQVCSIEQQLQQAGEDNGNSIGYDTGQQRPGKHILARMFHRKASFHYISIYYSAENIKAQGGNHRLRG